ncbi:MAG: hypothetical protein HZA48_02125 [Planctomycetes bacterium]|nr:hypothetical protein [Planctomycetota bacterium]
MFVLGAGASRSITEKSPLMNDFFGKAIEYYIINEEWKQYPQILLALIEVEKNRLFPSNVIIEAIADKICQRYDGNVKEDSELNDLIQQYCKVFIEDATRYGANLENIFSMADNLEDRSAFNRMLYAINAVFSKLHQDISEVKNYQELACILSGAMSDSKTGVSIITFNYDIWLEKEMQKAGLWHPGNGYGVEFDYVTVADIKKILPFKSGSQYPLQIRSFENNNYSSRFLILKPHGSLSWYYDTENSKKFVMLDSDGIVSDNKNKGWEITDYVNDSDYVPLLIPPTFAKERNNSLFGEIDKQIQEKLSDADVVVIIGWSMPETDIGHVGKIEDVFNHKKKRLSKLVVCDTRHINDRLYSRFESVFKPKEQIGKYPYGFSIEFLRWLSCNM